MLSQQKTAPGIFARPATYLPGLSHKRLAVLGKCLWFANSAGKREALNVILKHWRKTASPIFYASNGVTWVTLLSYLSDIHPKLPQQGNPIGALNTEKLTEAFLLYVFTIAFPASIVRQPCTVNVDTVLCCAVDIKVSTVLVLTFVSSHTFSPTFSQNKT